jgi:DNA-binding CsgD family transcriptional regulator
MLMTLLMGIAVKLASTVCEHGGAGRTGLSSLLKIWSIAKAARREDGHELAPTLLEREAVLAEMDALFRSTAGGSGQILLLRGEAGVGRSSLLHRFLEDVAGAAEVLLGRCDPLSAPRPLGPLIDMFNRLPGVPAATLSAAIAAGHSESVYRQLLDVLHDGRRRVCVIDDAHWADGATLDLLCFLARRIDALPVLVVVSYRDDELGHGHPLAVMLGDMSNHASLTRINLSPLSIQAVGTMAAGVDTERLYALTGGNPFYVKELLAAGSNAALPRSVVESAWGRLARLSARARQAAEAVAVCGPDIDPLLVETLCSGDSAGLDECLRVGLLGAHEDVVRFRHELVRLATLEQIPDYVRRGLNRGVLAARTQAQAETRPLGIRQSDRHGVAGAHAANAPERPAGARADPQILTRREREILELLAVGHSDAAIANRLFISQRTVNNHVHAILHKLGAENRTQAATYARQWSIESAEPEAAEG